MDLWTLAFIAILAVALLVRLWRLGSMPPALHPDEMAGLTGVLDEVHGRMPLRPFFDYRIFYLPLTGIGEYVSSLFFGYNAWAYRLPSVLYGLVTIVATAGLTYRLTRDRASAVCAAAISAILPWEITVSRLGWENASMLPFLMSGLWALRAGIDDGKTSLLLLGGALLGIDAYSYRAALPDAALLACALVAATPRARASWRGITLAAIAGALLVAPLAIAVWVDPRFFWRDAYISTFRDGVTSGALGIFVHNYLAHLAFGPLFFTGDGNGEHGPAVGVLYLWMLPMMLFGLIATFARAGRRTGFLFCFWLAIYPIGGALTNDGVPHFLRTLIGAPLAAMLSGIGVAASWRVLRTYRFARAAAVLFILLVAASFSQFLQTYFIAYEAEAADAFQYVNRELFTEVRAAVPASRRVCFRGLDDMNARTLFSYYLVDLHLDLHERLDAACYQPDTLVVVNDRAFGPPGAHLLATAADFEGRPRFFIFLTN